MFDHFTARLAGGTGSARTAGVIDEERRVFPDPYAGQPVGAQLRREQVPDRERDVLRRRHPVAEQRVGVEVGVIEAVDHGLGDDSLELAQIDHHPGALIDRPAHGDVERVVVAVGHREPAELLRVLRRRPVGNPVAVAGREREAPRRARLRAHGRPWEDDNASSSRAATRSRSKSSTRRRPAAPSSARNPVFVSTLSIALASSSGSFGLTRSPVRPSSTTSGTAAVRHATIGNPAAIASANTSPKPSWMVGRQKQSAPTYSTASAERLSSPKNVTTPARPRLVVRVRRRTDSGPSPTMRTRRSGIRERSRAAARTRSSRRLRGYIRATESTVGAPAARGGAPAKRRRHSARSIGSGTTAMRSRGTPYTSCATPAE